MSDDKYNDGYTHEALHTTFVLMDTFELHIINSRCANEFADVNEIANRIADAMGELYQLIGTKFSEETNVESR